MSPQKDPDHRRPANSAPPARPSGAGAASSVKTTPLSAAPPAPPPSTRMRALCLALLALVAVATFSGVLQNGWILLDDPHFVYENAHINRGLTVSGIVWFLTHQHGGNWEPLTTLSHMLDVQLFGLAPAGHHATSLLLHVLNALLLVLLLQRMTGAWWRSLLVAALFVLHPLRVESVAWISERKDVLSTLFFLLTLGAYRRWTARPTSGRMSLVFLGLVLGLASKPMLVTLPFVLLLLDVWPLGRLGDPSPAEPNRRPLFRLVAEKWMLFAASAAAAVATYIVQASTDSVASLNVIPLAHRLGNIPISYWRYIWKTLWPTRLAVFYPYGLSPNIPAAVAAAAGILAVTAAVLWQGRRRPWLAAGWFWYVGMLVPVIGLVQVGGQAWADRYTYIPIIGLLIGTVWGLSELTARLRVNRAIQIAAVVSVLASLAVATARQVPVWRDTVTLYSQVIRAVPGNPMAVRVGHRWVGRALYLSGKTAEAIPHLEAAFGLTPGIEENLRQAIAARPAEVENRRRLAVLLARELRVAEAIREYKGILAIDPYDLDALNNVAWMRATCEDPAHRDGGEAVRLAELARDRSPEPVAVLYSTLAAAYAEAGQFPEAVRAGERAVALARDAHQTEDAARFAAQLTRYRAGRPFHFFAE